MKKLIIIAAMGVFALTSCRNQSSHTHSHEHEGHAHTEHTAHDHSAHNHEAHDHEAHAHDHSAHNHEAHDHEAHDHDHEAHNHEAHDHSAYNHETHNYEAQDHEAHDHADHAHGEIVLSPEQAAAAGVKTQRIDAGPFSAAIRTAGRIGTASGKEVVLVAGNSGILSWQGRRPSLGQQVSKGQTIGSVSAEAMSGGDAAAAYRITYEAALKEYERAKMLREQQIISERQFIQAEAEYKTALNAYQASVSQDGKAGIALIAPISGYITEILKLEGEYVAAGETIAIVSETGKVQLIADLPEKYINLRRQISSANFRLSYSNQTYNTSDCYGRLLSVGASVSQSSAYLPVTFELINNGGAFVPGSYAEVWLITSQRDGVISVPETALTEEQGEFFVYQKLDAECYKKLPVKLGERNGKQVEILSGLHGGEEIVTEGAFQVKISAASVIPGHTHNH